MTSHDWTVHPNRFELGPDQPGRNGHARLANRARSTTPTVSPFQARIQFPADLAHLGDSNGTVTFGGNDWWFVVGAARAFARNHIGTANLPGPFGFKDAGQWWWWDDTTSQESILDTADAQQHVREYLGNLFSGARIEIAEPLCQ